LVDGKIQPVNTDEQKLTHVYVYENELYAYQVIKPGSYKLVKINQDNLELDFVKDIAVKEDDLIIPMSSFDGNNKFSRFVKYDDKKRTYTIYSEPQH